MPKTSNTTLVSKKQANKTRSEPIVKKQPWLEDYLDLFTFKMKPVSQAFIERIAQELNEWSKKDTSLVFRDFYDERDIPEDTFYSWIRKYPEIKEAHAAAKGRLGSRREKGVIARKFEPGLITYSMGMYDSQWKEFVQWKANLKQSEDTHQKVVIEINDLGRKES